MVAFAVFSSNVFFFSFHARLLCLKKQTMLRSPPLRCRVYPFTLFSSSSSSPGAAGGRTTPSRPCFHSLRFFLKRHLRPLHHFSPQQTPLPRVCTVVGAFFGLDFFFFICLSFYVRVMIQPPTPPLLFNVVFCFWRECVVFFFLSPLLYCVYTLQTLPPGGNVGVFVSGFRFFFFFGATV